MTVFRTIQTICAATVLSLMAAGPAAASLFWNYQVTGSDLRARGVIKFSDVQGDFFGPGSGLNTAEVLDFQLQAWTFGVEWGCSGADCLQNAFWSINPDGTLGDMSFVTQFVSDPSFSADYNLSFALSGSPTSQCSTNGIFPACDGEFQKTAFGLNGFAEISEPGAFGLIALGLAGLIVRRRRKAA